MPHPSFKLLNMNQIALVLTAYVHLIWLGDNKYVPPLEQLVNSLQLFHDAASVRFKETYDGSNDDYRVFSLLRQIRVEIWRQAYAQRGPQIVEIESCTANHEKYACRLCGREKGDPFCYHFENDQTLRCNHAKELKSHFSCNGIPHLQRRKNSAPSNILWVNRESRCEAQKIGMLEYRLSIYTRALATSTTTVPSSIPIYLDFAVDTLAVSTRTLLRGFCGRQLRGTEKIQRLIVLDFNENLVVLADVLQQFSGLKELYFASIAAEVDSNTRLLSPGDLRLAAVTDLFGFLKLFRKQFNWLREQQYGHPVCNVEWIFAERNADGSLAPVLPTSRYMTLGFTWSHQQDLGSYMGGYSESFRQEFCSLLRKWHQEWADEWAADWLAYYSTTNTLAFSFQETAL